MTIFYDLSKQWLGKVLSNENLIRYSSAFTTALAILLFSIFFYYLVRRVLHSIIPKLVKQTKTQWDDVLLKNNFFKHLSHLAPALIIYSIGEFTHDEVTIVSNTIATITKIYFIIIFLRVVSSFLDSVNNIYKEHSYSKERPIKGYLQLVMTFMYVVGGIIVVSTLLKQDPLKIFTGLGAMAAVILLVFKDTILGLVASVQVAANKMVKIGDWIEIPGQADGTVEEINLTSVKVQNWDKTISTLPTYTLVSSNVKNWKGMEESGGRRIKRSIQIDMSSVGFCDQAMIDKLAEFPLIGNEILRKQNEIKEEKEKTVLEDGRIGGYGLTNIGIFRSYLEKYLRNHPLISNEMTFLVRQLQPNEKGLPIEIYVFSKKQQWSDYERVQADILDHVLAILPEFQLSVFQSPTGNDFKSLQK